MNKTFKNEKRLESFSRIFSLTNWIILINVIIFIISLLLIGILGEEKFFSLFALHPATFFSGKVWTLLTSMFLHTNIIHLIFNMLSLFFVGNFVEKIIGRKRFFWIYLLSGIFAGIFYVSLSYFFGLNVLGEKIFINPNIFAMGASGAIFSMLGVLAILTPNKRVFLIAGPIIALIIEVLLSAILKSSPILNIISIITTIYFMIAIFSMFSLNPLIRRIAVPLEMSFKILPLIAIVPLIIAGLFIPLPIGNTAHLGGLIAGMFYGLYLKKRYKRKTDLINRYFSQ